MKMKRIYRALNCILILALLICIAYLQIQSDEVQEYQNDLTILSQQSRSQQSEICLLRQETRSYLAEIDDLSEVPKSTDVKYLLYHACLDRDVDYQKALAIAMTETGRFTSDIYLSYNNIGGMRTNGDFLRYDTLQEGVNAYVLMLSAYYFDVGLDTFEEMQPKYCPDGRSSWLQTVTSIYQELGSEH